MLINKTKGTNMTNRSKLLTATLLLGALFTTGCSTHKAKTPHKKIIKTTDEKKDTVISSKESIDKNANLLNKILLIEEKIATLEKQIAQTTPGAERAKMVTQKAKLEQEVEALKNKQIQNAKAFKDSRQKND
jgi:septal ring factor EnvC (AmiA/AmiB activator)